MSSTTHRLHNTSQLMVRHLDQVQASRHLIVGYPDDHFCLLVRQQLPWAKITAFNLDYASHKHVLMRYRAAGFDPDDLIFGASYNNLNELHDAAIIFLPKGRTFTELLLTMVAANLKSGAQVFLVGENNAGVRSSRHVLERIVGRVVTSDAARHCTLFQASLETNHIFNLYDWAITYTMAIHGQRLHVVSFPGVFSHGRLDDGTRLLLENLDIPTQARVLDFGCGSGMIGALVKKLRPEAIVDMVDTNALALESTRRTAQANGLAINAIWPSDVFSEVQDRYTLIVSNPPFHIGISIHYRVVENFFQEAASHLEPGGILQIVANRFLKYKQLIQQHVGECKIVAENRRFRVYAATRT